MGKAQTPRDTTDVLIKTRKDIKKQFGIARQNFAGVSGAAVSNLGGSGKSTSQIDVNTFITKAKGGSITGHIAFFPKNVTVSGGVISLNDNSVGNFGGNSSRVVVIGDGGADDLDTITGGVEGQLLFLQGAPHAITLKHGTGNIETPDSADVVMVDNEIVILQYDTIGDGPSEFWRVVSTYGGSGGSVSQWATFAAATDIDYATFDGINIDRLLFDQTAGSSIAAGDTGITSTALGDISQNVPTGGSYFGSINDVNHLTLQITGVDPVFQIRGTDTTIPHIRTLQEKGSAPTLGTAVGRIQIYGTDSTGSTQSEFGSMTADYEDVTIGSEDGSLHLNATINGTPTAFISLHNSADNKISLWKNQFMTTGIDIEMNENDLWFDTAKLDRIYHDGTGMAFDVDGAEQFRILAGGTTMGTGKTAVMGSARLTPHDLVPISTNGVMYYDLSENKFKAYENGAWVDIINASGGGGGGMNTDLSNMTGPTAPTVDLNMNANDIVGVANIDLDGAFATIEGIVNLSMFQTSHSINSLAGNMIFQVGTGDQFQFFVDGYPIMRITAAVVEMEQGVDMNDNPIVQVNKIEFSNSASDYIDSTASGIEHHVNANDEHLFYVDDHLKFTVDNAKTIFDVDTDHNGHDVREVNELAFTSTGQEILTGVTRLAYQVPSGDSHGFFVAGSLVASIDDEGLDLNVNEIIDFGGNAISLTAGSGFQSLPANPVGFINIKVGGANYRVPYYTT